MTPPTSVPSTTMCTRPKRAKNCPISVGVIRSAVYRRNLNLKAKFEGDSSQFSFKRCNQARFQLGF
jgi:hypothetical protein